MWGSATRRKEKEEGKKKKEGKKRKKERKRKKGKKREKEVGFSFSARWFLFEKWDWQHA